ncbi:MAG: penicillin-binding transpeptidase domain-containing protein, partial [Planktomarina sp.]
GVRHDLPLSAISRGVAPDKAWKRASFDQAWLIGDTVNASIGQGYVLASPLQLAVMSARLGTGRVVTPRLIDRIDGEAQPSGLGDKLDVDPKHLALVQKAMFGVTNVPGGTAFRRRIVADDMQMAGKTGTAQVRQITAAERAAGVIRNEDLPWARRDHALFVNYAPAHDPKVAVAVVVEYGGSGGAVAAPIARDVTLFALSGKMPDVEAYPAADRKRIAQEQLDIAPKLTDWSAPQSGGADQA